MKKLITKGLLLLFPFILIVSYFIISDPMKIVYSYDNPLEKGVLMNDRHFQYKWLKDHHFEYNSFIFGSSRSKAFHTKTWQKYIGKTMPFHMGVNDESLFGIEHKLSYLDREGYKIENALIILDTRILKLHDNPSAHIFREHPIVSGESEAEYYKRYFIAFLTPKFLKAYYTYYFQGKFETWMNTFIWNEDFIYDKTTGDHFYTKFEDEIKMDSVGYYNRKSNVFYNRENISIDTINLINQVAMDQLMTIKSILLKNNTNYKIVISPTYDQKPLSKMDEQTLIRIFGADNVFNFSGKNKFSDRIGDFYEERHFKPYIAEEILSLMYNSKE